MQQRYQATAAHKVWQAKGKCENWRWQAQAEAAGKKFEIKQEQEKATATEANGK